MFVKQRSLTNRTLHPGLRLSGILARRSVKITAAVGIKPDHPGRCFESFPFGGVTLEGEPDTSSPRRVREARHFLR